MDWRIGDFQFGYRMRFIQGTTFDHLPRTLCPRESCKCQSSASAATPDVYYHDIVGSYDYRNFSFNVGIDNLFDKAPPFVNDTATNTDPAVYDVRPSGLRKTTLLLSLS